MEETTTLHCLLKSDCGAFKSSDGSIRDGMARSWESSDAPGSRAVTRHVSRPICSARILRPLGRFFVPDPFPARESSMLLEPLPGRPSLSQTDNPQLSSGITHS